MTFYWDDKGILYHIKQALTVNCLLALKTIDNVLLHGYERTCRDKYLQIISVSSILFEKK